MSEIENKISNRIKPPRLAEWILRQTTKSVEKFSILGDYEEEFVEIADTAGLRKARVWYLRQTLNSVIPFLLNKYYWRLAMFNSYLKIALRNIKRYKGYSFINITGLTVGITCFILILLYVQHELSYDKYHKNANEIYRIVTEISYSNTSEEKNIWNCTPFPLKAAIEDDFPEVLSATRVLDNPGAVKFKNQIHHEEKLFLVDPEFLEIFSFPLVKGNPETALNDPSSVLLTEETAVKYFGQEDPLGKAIQINNYDHQVTGILKAVSKNSHFTFDVLVPFLNVRRTDWGISHWTNWGGIHGPTYIRLQNGVDPVEFEKKLPAFFKRHAGEELNYILHLEPMASIHLKGKLRGELELNGDTRVVNIFSATGLLILLIACFNYINLSTARSEKRAKEVGIRKVAGADRRNLTVQFFMESMIFSLLAFILSIPCVNVLLPLFGSMVGRELHFNLLMSRGWLFSLIGIAVFVGLVSGGYPALYLSSFKPVRVIKGIRHWGRNKATSLRNVLVVGQFMISVALIICTMVIINQLNYIKNRKLGFSKEHIVAVIIRDGELRNNLEPLKNTLSQHARISDVCYQERLPSEIRNIGSFSFEGMTEEDQIKTYVNFTDHNYLNFYNIELSAGRNFSKEMTTDLDRAALLNQSAVNAIRFDNPIGKRVVVWGREYTIIGVLKDFHFLSLHQSIAPLIIGLSQPSFLFGYGFQRGYLTLKLSSKDIQNTLTFIKKEFKKISPNYAFEYSFLDDRIDRMYNEDKRAGKTYSYFSSIAIIIACLGLFGLAAFSAERRTKEIGIRKVLGASMPTLLILISKDLTKWILVSNVIAWPVAYGVMNKWLQNFAYRINLGIDVFAASTFVALLIALITVSYQSIKAARANPVDSLRYE